MKAAYYNYKDLERARTDGYNRGVEDTVQAVLDFSVSILSDKFGFQKEDVQKFSKHFNYLTDSCLKDYVSISDIHESVEEENK